MITCGPVSAQVLTPTVSQRPPVPVRCQTPVNSPDICRGLDYYYGTRRSRYLSEGSGQALALAGEMNYETHLKARPGYRSPVLTSYRARRPGDALNSRKRQYKTVDLKNLR